jgi:hypothetical protein
MGTRGSWTGPQWPERPGQPPCRVPGGVPQCQWRCQWPARQLERQGTVASEPGSGPGLLPGPGGARNRPGGPWCTRPATLLTDRVVAAASGGPRGRRGLCLARYTPEKPAFGRRRSLPAALSRNLLCRPLPRTPRPVERTITNLRAECRRPSAEAVDPLAVHVEGGESSGPAPALATTVPEVFLIFVCYRGSQDGPVSRALLAGHTQQGSRPCRRRAVAIPKRRHVCARCHRKKTDLQAGVLCSDGTLL